MMGAFQEWIRRPIGRLYYLVCQFIGVTFADALFSALRGHDAPSLPLAPLTVILFAAMGVTTAKRLSGIHWSQRWAFLAIGPAIVYLILGGRWADARLVAPYYRWAGTAIMGCSIIATLAYAAMAMALVVVSGEEED
jgi:hypothetical protein